MFTFSIVRGQKKIAKKIDSLHVTVHVSIWSVWGRGEKPLSHFFVLVGGVFGTSGHHCQPLGVLVPSFGTSLTVCPVCESSGSQCSRLNRLDSTSSKLSPGVGGEGGSVIT